MERTTEWDAKRLANCIDHTYLKPDATKAIIDKLCDEAVQYGFYSVCVNGMWVARCRERLAGKPPLIAAVTGFPLGSMSAEALAYETAKAVEDGAREIDTVLPVGPLLEGDLKKVERHISLAVKAAGVPVKVILETGYLNDEQKRVACQISEAAGAAFVKTSTGFGPGGATVEDIRLMRAAVSPSVGVKASGGVRDRAKAIAMIEAGASRIGTSSGIAIVGGAQESGGGY
jgi:deoxyribose-phosphate aldolase